MGKLLVRTITLAYTKRCFKALFFYSLQCRRFNHHTDWLQI